MTRCPACGAGAAGVQPASPPPAPAGYRVVECSVCRLWYSEPMRHPGAAWYEASEIYAARDAPLAEVAAPPLRLDWRQRTAGELLTRPGLAVLDVGCGDGAFLAWAQRRGCDVHGADVDPRAVALAGQRVGATRVRQASAEEYASAADEARFDVICMFDVLEHLVEPVPVLEGLARRLTPSGVLCCTVPSHERWPRWFAPGVDAPPHHLTLWSAKALEQAAVRAGLTARVRRSPLVGEHLLDQLAARFPLLRQSGPAARALRAVGLVLTPLVITALRWARPDAGGFALMLVGRPRAS